MTYTVKGSDTLSGILKRFNVPGWNTPAVWNVLASQLRSKNPNRIYPGEVIDLSPVLPQQAAPTPAPVAPVAPAAPVKTPGTSAGQEAKRDPWESVMPWQQYFDENLVRSSEAARTARYFDPLIQRGREGIEGQYATRGLTRSGARGTDVMRMYEDMAGEEQKMREQLYGTRESQARENYGNLQSQYEKDARGFKKSTFDYTPYEYQAPSESPYRYASSYRQWLNNMYK